MYKIIRHLSIDVAIGASSMMYFVAGYLHTEVDIRYYFLLALITWLIYTTDHLMDARNIKHVASTPRHRFHQEYYKPILSAAIIGFFLFVGLIPRQTTELLFRLSLGLSSLVLLYFLSLIWARKTQFRYVLKELFIAGCYTVGVSLVPAYQSWPVEFEAYLFIAAVFCLALSNLLLFSVREVQIDLKDENPSAIRFLGVHALKRILQFFLWLQVLISVYLIFQRADIYGLLLAVMDALMMCLYYYPALFRKEEMYRVLGDGIFLLPIIAYFV